MQLLSFSVDPARDTPPVLRAYADRWGADPDAWRFLTGPEHEVVPLIVEGFRLGIQALPPQEASQRTHDHEQDASDSYEVMHSGRFVLIDRQGRIRAYYDGRDFDFEQIVRDIRKLLRVEPRTADARLTLVIAAASAERAETQGRRAGIAPAPGSHCWPKGAGG